MAKFCTKQLILMLIALFSFVQLSAQLQVFSISQVDATGFPTVKAGYVALDPGGNPYKNLTPADFVLKENGISMMNSLQISCVDTLVEPSASIILVVDQSGSMGSE